MRLASLQSTGTQEAAATGRLRRGARRVQHLRRACGACAAVIVGCSWACLSADGAASAGGLRGTGGPPGHASGGFLARRQPEFDAQAAELAEEIAESVVVLRPRPPTPTRVVLLDKQLVHFDSRKGVWQAVITVVPASDSPEVVRWWNDMEDNETQVRLKACQNQDRPHMHVYVVGRRTIQIEGGEAHGLHIWVPLPRSIEWGLTESRWVHSNIPRVGGRLTGTHPERALRITVVLAPPGRLPRLLFRAFWPLLMPLLFWDKASLVAKVAVACPFSFLLGLLMWIGIMTVKQHFDVHLRRFQRLARLSKLRRTAKRVAEVFSHEDCCICLADLSRGDEDLTMLLPCMHVVHHGCYSSWVGAPSYMAVHLRCPLCNCRTAGVAHPVAMDTPILQGGEGDVATAAPHSVKGASAADAAGASDSAQLPEL